MTAWLTQIIPDYRSDQVRSDLRDVVNMHKRVMALVPNGLGDQARQQAGVLYRIEESTRGPRILIQTQVSPELGRLPAGYGQSAIRDLGPLLAWLSPGAMVRYRIAANTSLRKSRSTKVVALRGSAADEWWTSRAPDCGLTLQSLLPHALDDAVGGPDRKNGIRHAVTRFDGVATIADPGALRNAILGGVGRGKSHGCGLLSIAPLSIGSTAAA
jgi:CRISPR system Cascade subunit CasE